jgi:molybdopterin converting factor small subunit
MASSTSTLKSTTTTTTGSFTLLLFASAASYTDSESLTLPAPTTLGDLFQTLEARFPGFLAKVLGSAAVTLNLEYVDVAFPEGAADGTWDRWKQTLEGWNTPVAVGDEVGVIPPVSSG